jgi:hypothetical protein
MMTMVFQHNALKQSMVIKPKILVINYVKNNSFFNKIIGYNNKLNIPIFIK